LVGANQPTNQKKRLASLKDETHIPILTHTLSALSQALSLDRLVDHSQDLFEVAMRALGVRGSLPV
jgi:pyruvate carboxylase